MSRLSFIAPALAAAMQSRVEPEWITASIARSSPETCNYLFEGLEIDRDVMERLGSL